MIYHSGPAYACVHHPKVVIGEVQKDIAQNHVSNREKDFHKTNNTVAIFLGDLKILPETLDTCGAHGIPLINASGTVRLDGEIGTPAIDARALVNRSMNGGALECANAIRRLAQGLRDHHHDPGLHNLEEMLTRFTPPPTTTSGPIGSGSNSNRHVHGMRRKGNNGHKRSKPRSSPASFAHTR